MDFWIYWCFIRVVEIGEVFDFVGLGFFVEFFWVVFDVYFKWCIYEYFDEFVFVY